MGKIALSKIGEKISKKIDAMTDIADIFSLFFLLYDIHVQYLYDSPKKSNSPGLRKR